MSQTVAPRRPSIAQRSRRGSAGSCQITSGLCGPVGGPGSSRASSTIPAATVALVVSSTRMKAPVTRLRSYGSAITGAARSRWTRPMSLSASSPGWGTSSSRCDVEPRVDRLDPRADAAGGVLEDVARAGRGRRVGHPAQPRLEPAGDRRRVVGRADQVAAAGVDVVGEHDGDRLRRHGLLERPVEGVDALDRGALALGQDEHLVAGPQDAARHLAGGAAVVGRADDPLDGQPRVVEVAVGRHLELLEVAQDRRPVVPRRLVRRLDDVVAVQRRDRDHAAVRDAEPRASGRRSRARSRGSPPRPSRPGPSC